MTAIKYHRASRNYLRLLNIFGIGFLLLYFLGIGGIVATAFIFALVVILLIANATWALDWYENWREDPLDMLEGMYHGKRNKKKR